MTQHETEETKDGSRDQFAAGKAYRALANAGVERVVSNSAEQKSRVPFKEIFLKPDVQLRDHAEIVDTIIKGLEARRGYRQDLLYAGIDGTPVYAAKSFGRRRSTYAVDEEHLRNEAGSNDRLGTSGQNPIEYALSKGETLPAVAVFNSDLMIAVDEYEGRLPEDENLEYWEEDEAEYLDSPGDDSAWLNDQPIEGNPDLRWAVRDGHTLDEATVAVFYFMPFKAR